MSKNIRAKKNIGAKTILKASLLFRHVESAALDELSELATNKQFDAGELVFRQGEPGLQLFGVLSGRVMISAESEDGREVHLNMMGPGSLIGEIALLDGGVRTATGTTAEPTTLCVIQRRQFLDFLQRHPGVAQGVIEMLCERVRWTSALLEDSAFHPVPVRLARRLNGLAGDSGGVVKISQTDLARFLNVSRQVVNGYLMQWQKDGQVEVGRGRVIVKDLSGAMQRT